MPTLTPAPLDALETLRQVNRDLSSTLLRLRPDRKHCSTIRPQDFAGILSQLRRAAEILRNAPEDPKASAALEREAREYRANLEKLKRSQRVGLELVGRRATVHHAMEDGQAALEVPQQ
jgi:hypothetical protein